MAIGEGLLGSVRFRLISGDVSYALQELTKSNIIILEAEVESELSALVRISITDYKKASKIVKRIGARCELLAQWGILRTIHKLRKRAILIVGCIILIILTAWIPTRVFFWEVKGNEKLPANYIIAQAQSDGLSFGCKRSDIRSEKIKNMLLAQIPQLEWVGVTTSGCIVTISVSESQTAQINDEQRIGNVVAICDGVVSSVTVTKGNPICKAGQAVQKGQVLISGYEDCGLVLKYSGAAGDVYANTMRTIEGCLPAGGEQRIELQSVSKSYSIKIGKNIIKFSKDSGIYDTSCVKMSSERYITLPGDFQLPFSLIVETQYNYESNYCIPTDDDYEWIDAAAESYLYGQMLCGAILSKDMKVLAVDDVYRFRGIYRCTEQIGVNMIEENLSYEKNG